MSAARAGLVVLAALATAAPALRAQTGLVIVAHGADEAWNVRVRETAALIRWPHGPVRVAFLMGAEAKTASWDSAVAQVQREGVKAIVAVPFMVSSYGSHVRQIRYYAGEIPAMPPELLRGGHDHGDHVKPSVPVRVTAALDAAPELGEALAGRWAGLSEADRARPLVLIAHGPSDADDVRHWEQDILAAVRPLQERIAPRPLRLGLLRDDAAPAVRAASVAALRDTVAALARAANDSVTALPVLISTGSVNTVKIPRDLEGLPVRYAPLGLAPHPALARWVERLADDARRQLLAAR